MLTTLFMSLKLGWRWFWERHININIMCMQTHNYHTYSDILTYSTYVYYLVSQYLPCVTNVLVCTFFSYI